MCPECKARFTTRENRELSMPRIVKRSGLRSQFYEEKLRMGIARAVEKRDIESTQIERLIKLVCEQIVARSESDEISSSTIGDIVLEYLKQLDEVAYIRFASVYRSFASIESFQNLVSDLQKDKESQELS